jgi:hypothetical protein
VCFLIQLMSVSIAAASASAPTSKRTGSSKKMKFNRRNASGIALSSTRRQTIGAKRLLSEGRVLDLLECLAGGNRIEREHEHDGIGAVDQRLQALPPILEGINLGAVDQWLEAARLQPTSSRSTGEHRCSRADVHCRPIATNLGTVMSW